MQHNFFKIIDGYLLSDIFPRRLSQPDDPEIVATGLNTYYNREYQTALNGYHIANLIPPEKALEIAYYFGDPDEIEQAETQAQAWVNSSTPSQKEAILTHFSDVVQCPKISPSQRRAADLLIKFTQP